MMMKQCCGEDGTPEFEKMKQFMESCGKQHFSEDEIAMMKRFCCQEGMPDFGDMKVFMEGCGCRFP
jgi:hypothetical protein